MEFLRTAISFILLVGLIASPFLILYWINKRNIKYKFIVYFTFGVIITATLTLFFAWWSNKSNHILLSHYGYEFDGMNDTERYDHVKADNLARVKSLEISIMGIGWPLRANMTYVFYSPYLLVSYLIIYRVNRYKKGRKKHSVHID